MNKLKMMYLGGKSFLKVVKDPNRTDDVFGISAALSTTEIMEPMRLDLASDPQASVGLATKPSLGKVNLSELAKLPDGTLGRAFADHMLARNFDPEFYPDVKVETDYDYIRRHLYETHDIWHVIAGFDTDVAGEAGLQAFYAAQLPQAGLAPAIIAAVLLNALIYDLPSSGKRMSAIAEGYQLGKQAKPLFGVAWKELWAEPLTAVRSQFNIKVA